jgi:hypothetical protein
MTNNIMFPTNNGTTSVKREKTMTMYKNCCFKCYNTKGRAHAFAIEMIREFNGVSFVMSPSFLLFLTFALAFSSYYSLVLFIDF